MAINVNTVYQTVLLILNKEQRGYLSPFEFNNIATQVQLEIIDDYLETLNQQLRVPQNESEYGDRVKNIDNQLSALKEIQPLDPTTTWVANNEYNTTALTTPIYVIGTVIYKDEQEIERVDRNEWLRINMSKLTRPSEDYPLYLYENGSIFIQPSDLVKIDPVTALPYDQFSVSYIRKPVDVVWAYSTGSVGQYIWDGSPGAVAPFIPTTGSQNFELQDTDQVKVILSILKYAGVVIRDPQIVQAAAKEIAVTEMNEKQ